MIAWRRLLEHAFAGINQDERHVGSRGAGHHVSGILHVPRGIGDDKLAAGGGKIPVGHVDGDSLFALRSQSICQQRQVDALLTAPNGGLLDCVKLILKNGLAVIEQPPDQGAFAVIYRAGSSEAEEFGGVWHNVCHSHSKNTLLSFGLPWLFPTACRRCAHPAQ